MKYRKGELTFYKGMLPKELRKYLKGHAENKAFVDEFLKEYEYNYVKKEWKKKEKHNTLKDRLKGED